MTPSDLSQRWWRDVGVSKDAAKLRVEQLYGKMKWLPMRVKTAHMVQCRYTLHLLTYWQLHITAPDNLLNCEHSIICVEYIGNGSSVSMYLDSVWRTHLVSHSRFHNCFILVDLQSILRTASERWNTVYSVAPSTHTMIFFLASLLIGMFLGLGPCAIKSQWSHYYATCLPIWHDLQWSTQVTRCLK